ncbi:MAG: formylglycine-generating enzyme family protein [Calditrichaeota bacterium]|nr:MAG: formylglycine-generating enzyme family protein [Calditrichota bacterium]
MKKLLVLLCALCGLNAQTPPDGMVYIPSGTYFMGIDSSALDSLVQLGHEVPHMSINHARIWFAMEMPRHRVCVSSFYMDAHEVTNARFRVFIQATGYKAQGDWERYATADRDRHPVVNVSWHDAAAYARWAGKRLPTEEEWEYAARGGMTKGWFPWGYRVDSSRANWRHQGESFWAGVARLLGWRKINTRPVGHYAPNGYGLYDMCGNVAEWCANPYQPYTAVRQDSASYPLKAVRGGHWQSANPVFIRVTFRQGLEPDSFRNDVGFRCVKDIP